MCIGDFLLAKRLLRLEIEEQEEAVVGAAGAEQPVAVGVKHQVLDEALELVVGELVRPLALLPVEDLDAGLAVEVVDVADLADAADGQQLAVRARRPATGCRRSSAGAAPGPRCT